MLKAHAHHTSSDATDALNVATLGLEVLIARDTDGTDLVTLGDGVRHVRLELNGDSPVHGRVELSYTLTGIEELAPQLVSLQRLNAAARLGRLPNALFPPDPVVAKGARALQAWDGHSEGASYRDIAVAVFGRRMVDSDSFDSMRKRVRRLLDQAKRLRDRAHHAFFGDA